ncbi:hypothetical protein HNY73_011128 [Argiope bruennichi]|uniref:Uncharacterized protein n=1 Tax=Argiope bruennichi TaxID=94029 RepID=A0A8T0F435_ARGBR|nr:hypothetical protein HNY73_011128 [Argiope bruennichi]
MVTNSDINYISDLFKTVVSFSNISLDSCDIRNIDCKGKNPPEAQCEKNDTVVDAPLRVKLESPRDLSSWLQRQDDGRRLSLQEPGRKAFPVPTSQGLLQGRRSFWSDYNLVRRRVR